MLYAIAIGHAFSWLLFCNSTFCKFPNFYEHRPTVEGCGVSRCDMDCAALFTRVLTTH